MKWFDNIKIRNKLLFVFGILVFIMISFAFYAETQITSIGNNNNELVNSYQARQISIADAIVDAYRMRFANLSRGYLLEDDTFINVVFRTLDGYDKRATSIMESLHKYREMTLADQLFTETEKRQYLAMVDGIEDSLVNYQKSTDKLKAAVENMDKQEVIKRYEEAIPLGNELTDKLEDLRDLTFFTVKKMVFETAESTAKTINAIFIITIGFILLSVFALLFVINSINRPVAKLEKAVLEISAGNLAYPVRTERKDEIGVLSNHIGDMVDTIFEHNKTMTIMDNLDSFAYVVDFDHNLLFVNKLMAGAFGLDRQSCLGQKCYQVVRKQQLPCAFCKMQELLPLKDALPSQPFAYMWDNILNAWIGGIDSIIRWTDGSAVFFRCGRDVTQKKRQEELLQEALQAAETASLAKSSFLANMSHEMRTPMNAVIGFSELLLAEAENNGSDLGEFASGLRKIHNAGMTLLGIINDILDISKIESGKFEIISQEYDMPSFINDTVMLNISRIGEKPIEFILDIDESLPSRLFGDELRIKQICNNLLSNAFKYTKEGKVIWRIACEREAAGEGVWMTISVQDTGVGIREQDLGKLFADYSQVDSQSNRYIEGTGLGLALAKRMTEMMDGVISVESEYGKGSVFTVKILQKHLTDTVIGPDVAEGLRHFQYSDGKLEASANLNRIRLPYAKVLLVDDLRVNLEVAKGMMKPYGMQVDCVLSGEEAVEAVRRQRVKYSAIFMDHMMPGMDGVEAARIIREEIGTDYAKNVPIIVLTANAIAGNEEMFLSKGFQAFLSKPIDIMRLDSVIRHWVRDKSLEEALQLSQGMSKNGEKEQNGGAQGLPAWRIAGLDMANILRKLGNEKSVLHVLRIFAEDTPELLAQLRAVTPRTLEDYRIVVHGIKGSCFSIYAKSLGEQAEKLEDAARAGQYEYVKKHNAAFINDMEKLLRDLQKHLESLTGKEKKVNPDPQLLADLLNASRLFDIDGVDKAMQKLTIYTYERNGELIDWLVETVKVMGFKEITERLARLLE